MSNTNRMLDLLWLVGYCGEFPSELAVRVQGHPEWNRHVKYRALELGYLDLYRAETRRRVIRSLRLTDTGLQYIGDRAPTALSYILAKRDQAEKAHSSLEKIMRAHSVAYGFVMSMKAGALFLPPDKPSLLLKQDTGYGKGPADTNKLYYYSPQEIRYAIQEYDERTVAKTSRLIGILVRDSHCYCMYFTGSGRMYWSKSSEDNTVSSIEQLLAARGLECTAFSQLIIGRSMEVARRIGKYQVDTLDRYFTVASNYQHCFFVENNAAGDELLSLIVNPQKQIRFNRRVLAPYRPPKEPTRAYDAVTPDGEQPVTLGYQCDLRALLDTDHAIPGFSRRPIILCFDYQADAIQDIVGSLTEVRPIIGGNEFYEEKNHSCD